MKGIELKKFQEIVPGHGDSRTFQAEIWIDGKKAGTVGNNGWGGPNEYHFWTKEGRDKEAETKFHCRVKAAVQELKDNDTVWIDDSGDPDWFIEYLIEKMQMNKKLLRLKKRNDKKGFALTLHCAKGKKFENLGGLGKIFTGWDQEWTVGLRLKIASSEAINEAVDKYKKKENPDLCEVVGE